MLITCQNCGHQISDKAQKCPKCGYLQQHEEKQSPQKEIKENHTEFSTRTYTKKSWKTAIIVSLCLILLIIGGFYLYQNTNCNTLSKDSTIASVDTTSVGVSDYIDEDITNRKQQSKKDFDGLRVINLIKHADSSKPPFNSVSIRNDWKNQILSLGFVQGDTEKFVYEGDDEQASMYGSHEITTVSEHFFLNIPNNEIEFIHAKDYEETFEIKFENPNTLLEFINSLISFGYKESRTVDGKRLFDCLKDENSPAGIGWIIDGKRVFSINSQC